MRGTPPAARRLAALLPALFVVGCSNDHTSAAPRASRRPAAVQGDSTPWAVSFDAYGPVRTGSPMSAVRAALGAPPRAGSVGELEACDYVGIPDSPLRVSFMVVDDTVVRIDVDSLPVATIWGDRVGDTEADVLARHPGHVRVSPHPYDAPEGHYLVLTRPGDTVNQIIFETAGGRVTSYRAGRLPAVGWIEGCQ